MTVRSIGLILFRAGAFAALLFVGSASGQEKREPVGLYESLRDVINNGADLFNLQADHAGCYRLYQGSLLSIKPLLKAELQREIDAALVQAEKLPAFADRAYELRKAIDRVREQVRPASPTSVAKPVEIAKPAEVKPKPAETKQKKKSREELIKVPPKKLDAKSGIDDRRPGSREHLIEQLLDVRFDEQMRVAVEEAVVGCAVDPREQRIEEAGDVQKANRLGV